MKVVVDQELCISCGLCVDDVPEVFDWNDDGKADVVAEEVPAEQEDATKEAIESCPAEAIKEA